MHANVRPEMLLQRYFQRFGDRIEMVNADKVAGRLKVRSDGIESSELTGLVMRDLVIQAAAHERIPASWGTRRAE